MAQTTNETLQADFQESLQRMRAALIQTTERIEATRRTVEALRIDSAVTVRGPTRAP